ncbi:ornithine cyclodeaminase family protein [Sulfolobus acidocaldarius]|uniref:Ornithine cyclodeaminase/mu-crystallin n=4 Tax=Sulfolobus acidocaldarius TaxID=2285 RepID=Q4J6D1_SULAC|nr:ornithine cyclodeaminase family protein [Sulfolobus acidocaldarius]AAY81650.1 ornithine cyclodeaminase/mu-crystallin [Sulfolobus acidocaldarius DSM 639]AGE72253.1 ornithine cyclodeaminase/mu-crystallin [Sulfolobus acidocaldarius N8]AGE74570.1 ornithine cyclodeaminase/mu-crystallin [Sulfolobus acidocaldarius Ron12/I]ALU29585.1 ornithine cyclodeaminase [Sulfolobus acidocaldarius]ALU32316.1 ornithine cyclodeaminase [Sulfolobus acidocaldarius]
MLVLNKTQLEEILDAETAVNAVKEAFSLYSSRRVVQPQRQVLSVKGNWWGIMPSYTDLSLAVKIVNVIPSNKERNIPSVQGVVILMSPDTGETLAILDGLVLTAIRTSSASILSAELAMNTRTIGTLGIIGAGTEARYHLKLGLSYFKVGRVLISARRNHYLLAKEFGAEAVELEKVLREADVIFSTTSSSSPVILGKYLRDDFHISSIGAHTPESREIDDDTIRKIETYMVDSVEAVANETGDYIQPVNSGVLRKEKVIEIGEVINRGLNVKRPSLFKTVGIASEDNLTAYMAYKVALKKGIGINVE